MENTYTLDTDNNLLHASTCRHARELVDRLRREGRRNGARTFDADRVADIWEGWVGNLSQEPPVRPELPLDCSWCYPTGDERMASDRVARAVLAADSPERRAQALSSAADRSARVQWIVSQERRAG